MEKELSNVKVGATDNFYYYDEIGEDRTILVTLS